MRQLRQEVDSLNRVVRGLDFCPGGSLVRILLGVGHFQPSLTSRNGFHVVKWGLVQDRTLFCQKLALRHRK